MKTERTIVVGDVHGCLTELKQLISKLNYQPDKDRLIFVGDLVDRGPDSVGVVKFVRELGAECVKGNHEEKHHRWRKHRNKKLADPLYKIPMKPLRSDMAEAHDALSEDDIAYLENLPLYIDLPDNWRVLHGGVLPGKPISEQDPKKIVRMRWLTSDGQKMLSLDDDYNAPEGSIFWTDLYKGPEKIIYGHNVASLEHPIITEYTWGIDTGCCFGGRLTAMILPTMEFVQVQSSGCYARWKPSIRR